MVFDLFSQYRLPGIRAGCHLPTFKGNSLSFGKLELQRARFYDSHSLWSLDGLAGRPACLPVCLPVSLKSKLWPRGIPSEEELVRKFIRPTM